MIVGFRCDETRKIWRQEVSRKFPPEIQRVALRKLRILNNATNLAELNIPPGNRLEALKGARAGQHSIRVNDQWRICFIWIGTDAHDVEMVDYH